jgi:hypothetical protein
MRGVTTYDVSAYEAYVTANRQRLGYTAKVSHLKRLVSQRRPVKLSAQAAARFVP